LNAISGLRAPTITPPARSSSLAGRSRIPGINPALQLLGPAAGRTFDATRRQLAVQEDGQPELLPHARRKHPRRRLRSRAIVRPDRDDRHDVRRADTRMRTVVAPQVDPLARTRDPGDQGVDEAVVAAADEREDGAVVVGVRVDVEQLGVP
jgi:hypothetical protein